MDALRGDCPACGLPLAAGEAPRARRAPWIIGGTVALVAIAAALSWLGRSPPPESRDPVRSGLPAEPAGPRPRPEEGRSLDEAATVHWPLTDPDGQTWAALVLASPRGPRLLLPLDALLASDRFTWRGAELRLGVVHADALWRYVLLVADGPLPAGVEPLEAGRAAAELADLAFRSIAPDGSEDDLVVRGRGGDGLLLLGSRAAVGAALLDSGGRAIAVAVEPGIALPLDPVIPWLAQPANIALAEARRELRRRDPRALVADVEAMLVEAGLDDVDAISRGLADLALAEALAREPDLLQRVAKNLRDLQVVLVHLLLDSDAARALAVGRDALTRAPDDPSLLTVTTAAALRADEPDVAALLLGRLRLGTADDDGVAEVLEGPIRDAAERLSLEGRDEQAIALAQQLTALLPRRAEVHATLAHALERAGRLAEAVAAAREATALDPSQAHLQSRLQEALAAAGDPDIVRIPVDPASGTIHADVLVSRERVQMVVDTGATLTTIPRQVASRLGLLSPANRRVEVETAGGIVQGELVRLDTVEIGSLTLRDVSAVVLDLPGSMAGRGLLGMSALRRFDVRIDSAGGFLELRRHRGR